jgi:L-lactate permease
VLFLFVYGRSCKKEKAAKTVKCEVVEYDIAPDSNKLTQVARDIMGEYEQALGPTQVLYDTITDHTLNEIVVDEGVCSTSERLTTGSSQLATSVDCSRKAVGPSPASELSFVRGRCRTCALLVRAYAPLLIAIIYAIATQIPFISRDLERLEFNVGHWGFNPVKINIFSAPAFPIFVAVASSYLFRVGKSNPFRDLFISTKRGASSLITLVFSSATVYLMLDTQQIAFLARALSGGGRIVYELIDPLLVFIGGMAFGQGAPAILLFSRIQIASAAFLGFPLALLVGLVNVVAMGPTNAVKPPLIRFATSLVNRTDGDREIFRIGIYWGLIQIVFATVVLFLLVLLWS